MGASGSTIVNFGAFPGSAMATADVATGGVIATSLIEAWLMPIATADHTDADHVVESMVVRADYVSDGNIRIYAMNLVNLMPPLELRFDPVHRRDPVTQEMPIIKRWQEVPMPVGQFTVAWVWI